MGKELSGQLGRPELPEPPEPPEPPLPEPPDFPEPVPPEVRELEGDADAEGVDKRAAFEAADVEEAVESPESLETLIPVHTAMAAQRRPITCAASVFFFMWNIFSCEH